MYCRSQTRLKCPLNYLLNYFKTCGIFLKNYFNVKLKAPNEFIIIKTYFSWVTIFLNGCEGGLMNGCKFYSKKLLGSIRKYLGNNNVLCNTCSISPTGFINLVSISVCPSISLALIMLKNKLHSFSNCF